MPRKSINRHKNNLKRQTRISRVDISRPTNIVHITTDMQYKVISNHTNLMSISLYFKENRITYCSKEI